MVRARARVRVRVVGLGLAFGLGLGLGLGFALALRPGLQPGSLSVATARIGFTMARKDVTTRKLAKMAPPNSVAGEFVNEVLKSASCSHICLLSKLSTLCRNTSSLK